MSCFGHRHRQHVFCFLCEFTVELAAHQLHAQGAGLATHHRDHADVLGDDWGVKQVGLGPVVVHVSNKHLQRREESGKCVRSDTDQICSCWMMMADAVLRLLTWSFLSPSGLYTVNVLPSRLDASLKALMNSAVPMRLAPCVTIPVKRIFLCILI